MQIAVRFNGTKIHFQLRIRISLRGGVIEDGSIPNTKEKEKKKRKGKCFLTIECHLVM